MATTSAAPDSAGALSPGAQLGGGRYVVRELLLESPLGPIFLGVEKSSNRGVEILAIDPDRCRAVEEAADAAPTEPAGIAGVVEVADEGTLGYVVLDTVPGHPAEQLLARKKQTGSTGFAPRVAASIIGRICAAIEPAHAAGVAHGWIGMPSVRVEKSGNVTLVGMGLAPLVAAKGRAPMPADDIAALGALLYHLLVGEAPRKGCPRPSEIIAGLPPEIDQVIAAAMHPKVERRPRSAAELRAGLKKALERPAPAAAPAPAASSKPSLAESISMAPTAPPTSTSASGQMAAALADTDEAWLINKDRLDYGPFTMASVVEQIQRDEILPGHLLINKHSGDRTKVEDHPLLAEIVDEARAARDERRRAQAEVVHAKTERRRGAVLYLFIAAAVLGLAGGAYLIVTALSSDDTEKKAGVGSLEEGKLEAKISFPTTDKKSRRGRRRGRRKSGGGIAGGWDDTVDLGDATDEGGDERLSDSQINPVVQSAGGRLGRCLTKTGEHRAAIAFIVKGTGRVAYVKVNGKTDGALANCVRGVMKSLQFPTFDGARTKANFTMSF